MFDCWSLIEPGTFKVRAQNYLRYIKLSLIHYFNTYVNILFYAKLLIGMKQKHVLDFLEVFDLDLTWVDLLLQCQ